MSITLIPTRMNKPPGYLLGGARPRFRVSGEGLEDPALTVPAARQIIAEQLKLQARI